MKLTLFCFIAVALGQRKRDRDNSNKQREETLTEVGTDDLFSGLFDFQGSSPGRDAGQFGDYADFSSFTTTTSAPGFDYNDLFGNYDLDYNSGSVGFDNYNYLAFGDEAATTTNAPTTFPAVTTPQTTSSTSSTSTT